MQDDREFARHGDDCATQPATFGDGHAPGLQRGPSLDAREQGPASSIRERIYADTEAEQFGILLYTGSPDAEGTLGGLVQQARHIEDHLAQALRMSALCSNDPVCAQHAPGESLEGRWLHGAACHGCALVAETSCEMRNDYLDRALVVPVLGVPDAAFFPAVA
jgi:Domain of unknown function (DUF1998)